MRRNRPQHADLRPKYSTGQYLVAGLLSVAALVTTLIAVAYPAAVLAVLLAAGAAVAARTLVSAVRAHGRRQRDAGDQRLCVPATDVCLKV